MVTFFFMGVALPLDTFLLSHNVYTTLPPRCNFCTLSLNWTQISISSERVFFILSVSLSLTHWLFNFLVALGGRLLSSQEQSVIGNIPRIEGDPVLHTFPSFLEVDKSLGRGFWVASSHMHAGINVSRFSWVWMLVVMFCGPGEPDTVGHKKCRGCQSMPYLPTLILIGCSEAD